MKTIRLVRLALVLAASAFGSTYYVDDDPRRHRGRNESGDCKTHPPGDSVYCGRYENFE